MLTKQVATIPGAWFTHYPVVALGCEPSGWVSIINRSVGIGECNIFSVQTQTEVMKVQLEYGLEPTGVVDGRLWALFMPERRVGDSGYDIAMVKRALNVGCTGELASFFDEKLVLALGWVNLDREIWAGIVGLVKTDV